MLYCAAFVGSFCTHLIICFQAVHNLGREIEGIYFDYRIEADIKLYVICYFTPTIYYILKIHERVTIILSYFILCEILLISTQFTLTNIKQ